MELKNRDECINIEKKRNQNTKKSHESQWHLISFVKPVKLKLECVGKRETNVKVWDQDGKRVNDRIEDSQFSIVIIRLSISLFFFVNSYSVFLVHFVVIVSKVATCYLTQTIKTNNPKNTTKQNLYMNVLRLWYAHTQMSNGFVRLCTDIPGPEIDQVCVRVYTDL